MPKYRITAPDGRQYDVTAPDGATQGQVLAYVQSQHAPKALPTLAPSSNDLGAAPPSLDELNQRNHRGVQIGDEFSETMPAWKNAAYGLVSPVASAMVGVGQMTGLMDPQTAQDSMARIDAVRSRAPGKVAAFGGDLGLALAMPETRLANAGRLGRIAQGAAQGATYGAVQGVHDGESRAHNTELGAGLGALGQGASDALVAAGKRAANAIAPEVRQVWEKARSLGINLTPAQLSDSRIVQYMAHQFGLLPLSGAAAKAETQSAQFNRQLAQAIGVDAPRVTPEVYAAKKAADSAKFNDLTARNNLTVTGQLAVKLEGIRRDAALAGDDVHKAVSNAIDGLYSRMSADGIVPGRAYQALDSALGQVTKLGTPVSHFVGQVKSAIRGAMDDSITPADAAAWKQLRQEYANRKTIRDLVAKADGGDLPPWLLKGRVTANNAGKEAMASGTAALGDLAIVGSRMKPPASSGTAERLLVNQLANPLAWPGLFAGASVGRVVNSNRLAAFLMREGRGKAAQRLARVARGAPALLPEQGDDNARK